MMGMGIDGRWMIGSWVMHRDMATSWKDWKKRALSKGRRKIECKLCMGKGLD